MFNVAVKKKWRQLLTGNTVSLNWNPQGLKQKYKQYHGINFKCLTQYSFIEKPQKVQYFLSLCFRANFLSVLIIIIAHPQRTMTIIIIIIHPEATNCQVVSKNKLLLAKYSSLFQTVGCLLWYNVTKLTRFASTQINAGASVKN